MKSLSDYFLVIKDTKASVHDVKVVRGAEIGSDHHLVLMKLSKKNKGEVHGGVVSGAKIRIERLKTVQRVHTEYSSGGVWDEVDKGQQKRTKWWNGEVKEAVKKKKKVYLQWLQQKTTEAKEEYLQAKREARRVVIKAQNDEWRELGRSLQEDFRETREGFGRE